MDPNSLFSDVNQPSVERWANSKFVALLSLAGLLSGLVTTGLEYPIGKDGMYALGCVFGAFVAVALVVCGVLRQFWRAILLPFAAAGAFYLSWLAAGIVGFGLASRDPYVDQPFIGYPIAMFVGGVVGGFVVLGTISILVHPKVGIRTIAVNTSAWSLVGGVLGIVGWLLGPSLGMVIWSGVHGLGLAVPTESSQNALYGQSSHVYSLFVVWQTGMALVLAIMLLPYRAKSREATSNSVHI